MKIRITLLLIALFTFGCASYNASTDKSSSAMMNVPFGNSQDVSAAEKLWNNLEKHGLNDTPATLYVGGPPHGKAREVLEGSINGKRVI